MTLETETPEAALTPARRGPLRWAALWARRVGTLALLGATIYLAVMAVLWNAQVKELESIKRDLADQLADREATLEDATSRLEASRQDLDDTLTAIIESADEKAQAQDNQILFEDLATFMADCADEAGELVEATYDRDRYVPWSLRAYENSVRDYCNEVSAALRELIIETEGEGS
ncbi:MAG: hypothetical protein MUP36_03610 [Demequinaceae bacterium]|nr:hypothetical protein [Demequinaceae bacterium]